MHGNMLPDDALEAWLRENPDVQFQADHVGQTMAMMRKDGLDYFLVNANDSDKLGLYGKNHLKYYLDQKGVTQYFNGECVFASMLSRPTAGSIHL